MALGRPTPAPVDDDIARLTLLARGVSPLRDCFSRQLPPLCSLLRHEYRGCIDRIDITTGTLGKALGGASGGYTSAKKEIVALLRQRSRPYLFSNSVAPPVVAGGLKALEIVRRGEARERLKRNTIRFREGLERLGFELIPGEHPIIPIMFYEAEKAVRFAEEAMLEGVYVTAFAFPVVPKGKARIRTQVSSALSDEDIDVALNAFAAAKRIC